jgi:hypothetical protein
MDQLGSQDVLLPLESFAHPDAKSSFSLHPFASLYLHPRRYAALYGQHFRAVAGSD